MPNNQEKNVSPSGLWVPPAKSLLDPRDPARIVRVGNPTTIDQEDLRALAAKHETKIDSLAPYIDYPANDGPVEFSDDYDQDYRDIHDAGGVTLVLARYSQGEGSSAYNSCALDLDRAAERLEEFSGARMRHLLPKTKDLIAALEDPGLTVTSVDQDGGTFKNRFVFLYLRMAQLLLMVSMGSALKTRHDGRQPFVEIVSLAFEEFDEIGALVASAPDRITRSGASSIDLLRTVRRTQRRIGAVWICDGEQVLPTGPGAESVWLPKSAASEREGRGITRRTQSHLDRITADEFDGVRMRFPFSNGIPGGMCTYKSNEDGFVYLVFDSPQFHPKPGEDRYGNPKVLDDEQRPVDAVETLRLFFAMVLVPDITLEELTTFLISRHWSTQRLRANNRTIPGANYAMAAIQRDGRRLVDRLIGAIVKNLDFYRYGRLTVTVSTRPTKQTKTITGMRPAGGWGEEAAFDRLQSMWDELESRSSTWTRTGASLAKIPIVVDCVSGHLEVNLHRLPTAPMGYAVKLSAAARAERAQFLTRRGVKASAVVPNLAHDWIMAALLRACLRCDVASLTALVADDSVAAELKQTHAALRQAEAALEDLMRAQESVALTIETASLSHPERVQAIIDTLAPRQAQRALDIESARSEIVRLVEKVEALNRPRFLGVRMDMIEYLASEMQAGRGAAVISLLRDNIVDLRLDVVSYARFGGTEFRLTGKLVVSTDGDLKAVPFAASMARTWGDDKPARIARAARLMREGVVWDQDRATVHSAIRKEVREAMGPLAKYSTVFGVRDPDLLRLTMAILVPVPVPGEDPVMVSTMDDLRGDADLLTRFGGIEALDRLIETIRVCLLDRAKAGSLGHWTFTDRPTSETLAFLAVAHLGDRASEEGSRRMWPFDPTPAEAIDAWDRTLREQPKRNRHGWNREEDGRLRVASCSHCGGSLLAQLLIHEATGLLCLAPGCRRDRNGVRFDEAFDPYIRGARLYLQSGIALEHQRPQRTPTTKQRTRPRQRTQYDELSESDRMLIAKKYVDISRTVRDVTVEHGLRPGVAKRCADESGLVRRTGRSLRGEQGGTVGR